MYCECGCGRETAIITHENRRKGRKKGEHSRFIQGHSKRGRYLDWRDYYTNTDAGCWEWTGTLKRGYGFYYSRHKRCWAHREVYKELCGQIPLGSVIDHLCRNTKCINPEHLELVSIKENSRRRIDLKLSLDKACQIREKYASRTYTQEELAKLYNVSQMAISRIVNNQIWID